MKLSVSLPDPDVEFLDAFARERAETRSAALLQAVRLLRARELEGAYEEAFGEWHDSGERELWAAATEDGLDDPAR
ncbi:ribbon-helix-helix domain-containing protein [Luteipulveratus mongoliensis]|uniref:Antitoxin n=1 Tax=Luteipulveratus mongoliensis TaxID=571913 RepID=A0A0K1JMZ4_9MICO|nr:ribbon-helix-helix domain-containing protein [Luteipulveratus mongoliensis]AKU17950.1 antitoxin [Luteipulveratus mongoliensis]